MSYDRFPLQGGLDTATPYLTRTPGSLIASANFVPDTDGGYRMNAGFERFDGQPAPSETIIYNLTLDEEVSLLPGAEVTGSVSGAVGIVGFVNGLEVWVDTISANEFVSGDDIGGAIVQFVTIEAIDSRSYVIGSERTDILFLAAQGDNTLEPGDRLLGLSSGATVEVNHVKLTVGDTWVYATLLQGQPTNGEDLFKSDGSTYLVNNRLEVEPMLSTPDSPASVFFYLSEIRRGKIREVPGINQVRGVWDLEGVVYAFRDTEDGTEGAMYRGTSTGWQRVDLGQTLTWEDRPDTVTDDMLGAGDVIKGSTSGATATVGWVGYTDQQHKAGYVSALSITGAFVAGENILNESQGDAVMGVVAAEAVANTLPPGGKYSFENHNFRGGSDTFAMYGVNGVSSGFVYNDAFGFSFIRTGNTSDIPFELRVHKDHLFYAFPKSSLQHSVLGSPTDWSGGLGALEFGVGSEVSSLISSPKSLIICTEKDIQSLEGGSVDDWKKEVITTHTGVAPFTGFYLSQTFLLAQAGIMAVERTDQFGNFADSIISDRIRDLIVPKYARCTGAMTRKTKGQYNLFYDNGDNVSLSVRGGNVIGFSTFNHGGLVVRSSVNPYGVVYFISDTGFVYHDDAGASNDGAERVASFRTSFANQGDPDTRKRFRRMDLNITSASFVNARVSFSYDKGDPTPQFSTSSGMIVSGAGRWDISNWNEVYWDATESPTISSDIDGVGFDISTLVYIRSRIHPSFIAEDMSLEWTPRRKVR